LAKQASAKVRERRFVDAYIVSHDAKASAIAAGYKASGAIVAGSRLLNRPHVKAEIERRLEKATSKADITAERVMQEYARIAFGDLRQFYNDDGTLKAIHELDDDAAAALAGVDIEETIIADGAGVQRTKKIKRWDKTKALDSLARVLSMFNDTVTVKGDFAEKLVKARERAQKRT
jgi:phage terminase small subunit